MDDKKKKRLSNMDSHETQIFVDILKRGNNGKLWKIVTEGTAKKQEIHDVWVTAAQLFSKETGKPFDWKQAKSKWHRLKSEAKKRNDETRIQNKFTKQCKKTGGGAPPPVPPATDGDDLTLDLHDFEPTDTNYNELVRPQDRVSARAGGPGVSSSNDSPRPPLSVAARGSDSRTVFNSPRPLPSFESWHRQNVSRLSSPLSQPSRLPNPTDRSRTDSPQIRSRSPSSIFGNSSTQASQEESDSSLPDPDLAVGVQGLVDREVLIVDQSGGQRVVDAVGGTPKVAKNRSKKKNMNEEAANYYSRMLEIQENLAVERLKVYKLKQKLLKRKLENEKRGSRKKRAEDHSDREEESSESNDSSEDENNVDNDM